MGNGVSNEIAIFGDGELEAEFSRRGGAGDISVKKFVEKGYNDVIRTVIRPPRARYTATALGDATFPLPPQVYHPLNDSEEEIRMVQRMDFDLENDRGLALRCSHWQIYASSTASDPLQTPCLVYLHSNVGSRVDALRVRDAALARGFSVCAFDCSGSGHSDGIYVTCGWNESKDFYIVLQHLEQNAAVTSLCFYAHSMGTFPAIVNVASRSLVMSQHTKDKLETLPAFFRQAHANMLFSKPIKGMVLDGAYATMSQVTKELMEAVQDEGFRVPTSLLKLACAVIQKSVRKRADVDLDVLRPVDLVGACYIPAMLVTGTGDKYVASHHSDTLAAVYGGPAVVTRVEGDHYTPRTEDVYATALDFLYSALQSVDMR